MSPASKRAMLVNGTKAVSPEQRTGAFGIRFDFLSSTGTHTFGGIKRLPQGQKRHLPREPKSAAARANLAGTWQNPFFKILVDRSNLGEIWGSF
jgi:hypothetical protein